MSFESTKALPGPTSFQRNNTYFNGQRRLNALGVTIPPEMRVLEMVSAWPRITVEALEERLTVEGFSLAGQAETDDRFWLWWQANRMDVQSSLLHTEALKQGLAYALVGPGPNNIPKITVHSADQVRVHYNQVGMIDEAVLSYKDAQSGQTWFAYYTPGFVTYYGRSTFGGGYLPAQTVETGLSRVPIVPYINYNGIGDVTGVSEMEPVMGLADACSRSLTNLQIAQELLAMPQRYLFGAEPEEFVDGDGKQQTAIEIFLGRIMFGPEDAKAGQFPGADLTQIINTVNHYGRQVSAVTGIPAPELGISAEANPESADALNALANRHVKKAEKKQTYWGEAHEDVIRLCDELVTGTVNPDLVRLETRWRSAATPTLAQVSAAVVQLVGAGTQIIPPVVARQMLHLTPEQMALAAEAEQNDPVAALARTVGASQAVTQQATTGAVDDAGTVPESA